MDIGEIKTQPSSTELRGYLQQLDDTLKILLTNLNGTVEALAPALRKQSEVSEDANKNLWSLAVKLKEEELSRFDELKSEILATAEEITQEYTALVEQTESSIRHDVGESYVAESEYGTYTGQTATVLNQLTDSVSLNAQSIETVDSDLKTYMRDNNAAVSVMPSAIMSQVGENYFSKDEQESFAGEVESQITQTAHNITENYTNSVSVLKSDLNSLTGDYEEFVLSVDAYIRRGELEPGVYGIEIGRSDNGITARFVNDMLAFYQGGTRVAYLSDNNLYITRAEILDYLRLGNSTDGFFSFDVSSNGLEVRWNS